MFRVALAWLFNWFQHSISLISFLLVTSSLRRNVDPIYMEMAGNGLTTFMVLGIAAGCGTSFGLVNLV